MRVGKQAAAEARRADIAERLRSKPCKSYGGGIGGIRTATGMMPRRVGHIFCTRSTCASSSQAAQTSPSGTLACRPLGLSATRATVCARTLLQQRACPGQTLGLLLLNKHAASGGTACVANHDARIVAPAQVQGLELWPEQRPAKIVMSISVCCCMRSGPHIGTRAAQGDSEATRRKRHPLCWRL